MSLLSGTQDEVRDWSEFSGERPKALSSVLTFRHFPGIVRWKENQDAFVKLIVRSLSFFSPGLSCLP